MFGIVRTGPDLAKDANVKIFGEILEGIPSLLEWKSFEILKLTICHQLKKNIIAL